MKDFEKLDQLLYQALSSNNEPDDCLNQKIICQVGEKNKIKRVNKKKISAVAICALLIVIMSISAFAVIHLITPKQVAKDLNNERLATALEGENALAINQTQKSGDYVVSLLGIVSGKKISDIESSVDKVYADRTYAVVAIENADGTPMPKLHDAEYDKVPFFVSPYIKGQDPSKFNIITMNGGYSGFVKDGILYRIIECDTIEIFADRGLYIGVISSPFYDKRAYDFDLETGKIIPNVDYEGVNVLFDLPIDPSKGNFEKAENYLKTLFDQEMSAQETNKDIQSLLSKSTLIPKSVQEVIPNDAGIITYQFDGHELETKINYLFKEGQVGFSNNYYIDNKKILIFSRDKDGVVTVMTYKEK